MNSLYWVTAATAWALGIVFMPLYTIAITAALVGLYKVLDK